MAKTLALRLAAEWLVRFSHEPEAPLDEHPLPAEIGQDTCAACPPSPGTLSAMGMESLSAISGMRRLNVASSFAIFKLITFPKGASTLMHYV
ncbi:MAG: hypothetical protein JSS01_00820 [Proteobacteria bacterium]|nr:hypothetical protein [Pseudomonadota bacterium]